MGDSSRRAHMVYPDGLTAEQWERVEQYQPYARALAHRWARRCGYPDRVDEFCDELLSALMRVARHYDPAKGAWHAFMKRGLYFALRRCKAIRAEWDRNIHCVNIQKLWGRSPGPKAHGVREIGTDRSRVACDGTFETEWVPDAANTRPDTGRVDDADEVEYAMEGLDDRQQRIIRQVFWDGTLQRDIAAAEGISTTRVGQILKDSLATMQRRLTRA